MFLLIILYLMSPIPLLIALLVKCRDCKELKSQVTKLYDERSKLTSKLKEAEAKVDNKQQIINRMDRFIKSNLNDSADITSNTCFQETDIRATESATVNYAVPSLVQEDKSEAASNIIAESEPDTVSKILSVSEITASGTLTSDTLTSETITNKISVTTDNEPIISADKSSDVSAKVSLIPETASHSTSSHENKLRELIDKSNTDIVLTIGVALLILASVGFMTATWSVLGSSIRAICLLSFSVIFLCSGILAKVKLNLPGTSLAFYSIGSAALPITIVGASALNLFGSHFGITGDVGHYTFAIAFLSLLILTFIGARFFQSRVFAGTSLGCASAIVISLATLSNISSGISVMIISLFAVTMTLLAPSISRITESTVWSAYHKIIEVYSISNQYLMAVFALILSDTEVLSGLFILLMGFGFLAGSFLHHKSPLFSLPHILLVLVGSWQLFNVNEEYKISLWLLLTGIYLVAVSLLQIIKKPLNRIFAISGLVLSFISVFPLLADDNLSLWLTVPLMLAASSVFFLYGLKKRIPVLSVPSAVILELMFLSILLHTESVNLTILAVFICALLIWVIYSCLPHNRMYSGWSELILWCCCILLGYTLTQSYITVFLLLTLLSALTLVRCLLPDKRYESVLSGFPHTRLNSGVLATLRIIMSASWDLIPLIANVYLLKSDAESAVYLNLSFAVLLGAFCILAYPRIRSCHKSDQGSALPNQENILSRLFLKLPPCTPTIGAFISAFIMVGVYTLGLIPNVIEEYLYPQTFFYNLQCLITIIPFVMYLLLLLSEVRKSGRKSGQAACFMFFALYGFSHVVINIYLIFGSEFLYGKHLIMPSLGLIEASVLLMIRELQCRNAVGTSTRENFIRREFHGILASLMCITLAHGVQAFYSVLLANGGDTHFIIFFAYAVIVALLLRYEYQPLGSVILFIASFAGFFVISNLFEGMIDSRFLMTLLYLIPVFLFSFFVSSDKKHPIVKDPFLYGSIFASVIVLLITSSSLYSLLGFILVTVAYYIRCPERESHTRAFCLAAVTLASSVWLNIPFLPDGKIQIEQLYLLPTTLLVLLLPKIVTALKSKSELLKRIRLIYGYVFMLLLGIISVNNGHLGNYLFYSVIALGILIYGNMKDNLSFFILGAVSGTIFSFCIIGSLCGQLLLISISLIIALSMRYKLRPISFLYLVALALACLGLIDNNLASQISNDFVMSLIYTFPLIILSGLIAIDRKHPIHKDPFLYGAGFMALLNFFVCGIPSFQVYYLPGFLLICAAYYIRSTERVDRIRAICIGAVILTTSVWYRTTIFDVKSIGIYQLYLLPTTVLAVLLPNIVTKLKARPILLTKIRLTYGYIFMSALGIISINSGRIADRIVFAVISLTILIIAYRLHNRKFVILGAVSTAAFIIYIIGSICGERSWLVYFAVSGTILITIAVRNEIKRRNAKSDSDHKV